MKKILKAPAKINTFLKITGKENLTGMHFIESVMIPVNIFDTISIDDESDELLINVEGIKEKIPTENNIIYKAYRVFCETAGVKLRNLSVNIKKDIPVGAGLGGGSSDAAQFIKFLNSYYRTEFNMDRLITICSAIGSDVPFFLLNSPALVSGKGEVLEPLVIKHVDKYLLLLYPDIIINTGYAYALADKKKLTKSTLVNINTVRKNGTCSLEDWTKHIHNDFEDVICAEWPALSKIKSSLESAGAQKVFMSGSGSTLIAVYTSKSVRDKMFDEYKEKFDTVRKIELLTG